MIKLTAKEKAERYDALQAALKFSMECYKRRRDDSEQKYNEARVLGLVGAYTKGLADAYGFIVADLERWTE